MKLSNFVRTIYLSLWSISAFAQCETSQNFSDAFKKYNEITKSHPFFRGCFMNEYDTQILRMDLYLIEAEIDLIHAINSEMDFVQIMSLVQPNSFLPYLILNNQFWNENSLNIFQMHPELSHLNNILIKIHGRYFELLKLISSSTYHKKAIHFVNHEIRKVRDYSDTQKTFATKWVLRKQLCDYSNFELFVIHKFSKGNAFSSLILDKEELLRRIQELKQSNCEPFEKLADALLNE